MTVFDCFPFFREFELLRMRLRELEDVVDCFVLVEGSKTHTGHPKPYYFMENQASFGSHRIVARQVDLPGSPSGREPWFSWGREIAQRSALNGILAELASDGDLVVSGDADEIPRASAVEACMPRADIVAIEMRTYHYNLHCVLDTPTLDPKIARYRDVKKHGVANLRYLHQATSLDVIQNGGWHLSFMGGPERIMEKMGAYAHYDERDPRMALYMSRENVEASVKAGKSLFLRDDMTYTRTEEVSDLPRYVREHLQHFIDTGWLSCAS
jgi:beta-1,4-mannosyl-glycoprotein beta-1,4-N-acetylglucosaminyltransferase